MLFDISYLTYFGYPLSNVKQFLQFVVNISLHTVLAWDKVQYCITVFTTGCIYFITETWPGINCIYIVPLLGNKISVGIYLWNCSN